MSTVPHADPRVLSQGASIRWPHPPALAPKAETRAAWKLSLPLIVIVLLRVIPGPMRIYAWASTMFYALCGRRQAILALAVLWLLNLFTHAFGVPPGQAAIFRHLTIFSAAFSVFLLHAAAPPRSQTPYLLAWTFLMCGLLLLHSAAVSTAPDISIFKTISFTLSFTTLLTAWSRLAPFERAVTEKQLRGLLIALAVFSVPLIGSGAGYFRTPAGFQGLLEHPQAFGPMMAILAVWLTATWLTDRRMSLVLVPLLGLALVWIYFARARGAAVIFAVGVLAALVSGPLAAALNRAGAGSRILKRRLGLAGAVVTVLLVVALPVIPQLASDFFFKKATRAETISQAAWQSRGYLLQMMWDNIDRNPYSGIGFGVASSPERYSSLIRDPYFGITIMAATEKGVLPVAMVEELGWPFALLFAPWFLALFINAARAGPKYAGLCAAGFAMNMSECCFFSPGGGGLIIQVLVTMAATAQPVREPVAAPPRHV